MGPIIGAAVSKCVARGRRAGGYLSRRGGGATSFGATMKGRTGGLESEGSPDRLGPLSLTGRASTPGNVKRSGLFPSGILIAFSTHGRSGRPLLARAEAGGRFSPVMCGSMNRFVASERESSPSMARSSNSLAVKDGASSAPPKARP
jgi:hypothetical protein